MAALPPYSNPLNFTLTVGTRPPPFSDPYTFTLDPDPPSSTGNPYSDPYTFQLIADDPVQPNPFSDPYTFTLTGAGRPGPFSDPVTLDTRAYTWFLAADGGWVPARLTMAGS
jgi:hypothetical protein